MKKKQTGRVADEVTRRTGVNFGKKIRLVTSSATISVFALVAVLASAVGAEPVVPAPTNAASPVVSAIPSAASLADNDLSGTWKAEFDTQVGHLKYTYEFKADGETLSGKAIREREGQTTATEIKEGRVKGDTISFVERVSFEEQEIRIGYQGKVAGDEIKLVRKVGDFATTEMVARKEKVVGPSVAGTWKAEFNTQIGKQSYVYYFKVEGDKLTGRAIGDIVGTRSATDIVEGKVNGAEISFVEKVKFLDQEIPIAYKGRLINDEIRFIRKVTDSLTEEVVATRIIVERK